MCNSKPYILPFTPCKRWQSNLLEKPQKSVTHITISTITTIIHRGRVAQAAQGEGLGEGAWAPYPSPHFRTHPTAPVIAIPTVNTVAMDLQNAIPIQCWTVGPLKLWYWYQTHHNHKINNQINTDSLMADKQTREWNITYLSNVSTCI